MPAASRGVRKAAGGLSRKANGALHRATRAAEQGMRSAIHVFVLPLRPSGGKDLAAFLWRNFAKPPSGGLKRIAGGPYPASAFYAATGTYDGGYTCNTRTADALRHAGLSVTTAGVVFAGQVMRQVRRLCAECASPKASP